MPICNLLEKTGACNGVFAYNDNYVQNLILSKCLNAESQKRDPTPSLLTNSLPENAFAHFRVVPVY